MIKQSITLIAIMGLAGCASVRASDNDFTQAEADAMVAKCGAPKGLLTVSNGQLTMWPVADLNHDVSVCVLREILASGKSKFGFVGNEVILPEKEQ